MLDESNRAIPERNAYLMDSLLQSVMKGGTGAKAYQALKRDDIYGKTGTTNDSVDTWFAAFQPTMVGIAWVGYDTPRKLGVRGETGGSLSLPIWVNYMQAALKGVKVAEVPEPPGLMHADGELFFDDYGPGRGVASLGLDAAPVVPAETLAGEQVAPVAPVAERNRILDMFK